MYREEDRVTREGNLHEEIPRDEMLLDVCLEEVLSGQAPPSLSAHILASLEQSQSSGSEPPLLEPPLVEPPLVAPPVQEISQTRTSEGAVYGSSAAATVVGVSRSSARRAPRKRQSQQWIGLAAAASVLALAVGIGYLVWQSGDGSTTVATDDGNMPGAIGEVTQPLPSDLRPDRRQIAARPFSEPLFGANFPPVPEESAVPWPLPYAVTQQPNDQVVRFVNEHLDHSASAQEIDDDQWCRRVFQQVLGREPDSEELVDFATSDSPSKREQLVDRLLSSDRYREEYARHWAGQWSDELLASSHSSAGSEIKLASREGLQRYFYDELRSGKPHDELTAELIAATGSNRTDSPQYNGATNFVLSQTLRQGGTIDAGALTSTVSRVFLGHQGQCAQCHDAGESGSGSWLPFSNRPGPNAMRRRVKFVW